MNRDGVVLISGGSRGAWVGDRNESAQPWTQGRDLQPPVGPSSGTVKGQI